MRHCLHCGEAVEEAAASCARCGSAAGIAGDNATLPATHAGGAAPPNAPSPPGSASPPGGTAATGAAAATTAVRAAGLAPGADFGPRYRIEALLGEGGMGRVYRAYDRELDRTVALKIIQPALAADEEMMRRFKQELLLASRISQKNILRIHDLGEAEGVKFISMAYIEGEDLHRRLRREGRLPPEECARLARQMLEALAAAHEQGVVHRDLKPQNLLLDRQGNLYITDFGLARSLAASQAAMTQSGAVLGTPRYMSPEQVEGRAADARADLYAIGIILYEMATGDTPFHGETAFQLMYQRVKSRPRDPREACPDLPESLCRVIERCLEARPEDRYQSAREMLADLGGETAAAPVSRRRLRARTRRGLLAVGGACALAAALGGGWWALRHRTPASAPASAPVAALARLSGEVPPLARGKFVAILPFHFLGPANANYLALGMADSLSARLFQIPDVHLAGHDAPVPAVSPQDWPAAARALGANLVVQGTVAEAGGRLRVIVTLDNAVTGGRVWVREFNATTGDLFTLEDEIYGGLAQALALKPTPAEQVQAVAHPTENLQAYDLYLRGRQALAAQRSRAGAQAAIDLFTQALSRDPRFGLAYAGIADASLVQYDITRDAFWAAKARAAADQAAQLDPRQAEVLLARGRVLRATGNTDAAIAELRQAAQLAPNSDQAYRSLGAAYLAAGKPAQAHAAYEKAVQLNPYYWLNALVLGNSEFQLGDYARALAHYQRVTQLAPDNQLGYLNTGAVLLAQGKYQASLAPLQRAVALSPTADGYSNLGVAYFYLHQYAQSVPYFEKAVQMRPHAETDLGNLADALRWSGQTAAAKERYDRAIALAFQELQVNPRDADTMGDLAMYYAKEGNDAEAAQFARRARAIAPDDVALMYSQAVVDALGHRPDAAMAMLRQAVAHGYSATTVRQDPELAGLQKRADFAALVGAKD